MSTNFEEKLKELEAITRQLNQTNLPLETALQQFERGIILNKDCQKILKEAEQKVKTLTENNGLQEEKDFQQNNE